MGVSKTEHYDEAQLEFAALAKGLAHPARIAILQHIVSAQACINTDLTRELGLAQPTVSQHLKVLRDLNLIQGTIEGKAMCYCLNPEGWQKLKTYFGAFFKDTDSAERSFCC
jgi:predicted transcriptional regulator